MTRPRVLIERTKNRHSRATLDNGTIIIRLAKNLSAPEEQRHIQNLLRRMLKHALRERKRTILHPFEPLLSGEQELVLTLASGISYTFTLTPGKRTTAKRTSNGWHIQVAPRTRRIQLHRFLWSLLSELER